MLELYYGLRQSVLHGSPVIFPILFDDVLNDINDPELWAAKLLRDHCFHVPFESPEKAVDKIRWFLSELEFGIKEDTIGHGKSFKDIYTAYVKKLGGKRVNRFGMLCFWGGVLPTPLVLQTALHNVLWCCCICWWENIHAFATPRQTTCAAQDVVHWNVRQRKRQEGRMGAYNYSFATCHSEDTKPVFALLLLRNSFSPGRSAKINDFWRSARAKMNFGGAGGRK